MQFQIPQFIETEDKIVGPLSIRQFIYIGVAGAISMALYFILNAWLWAIISIVLVGASIAFATVKVNGKQLPLILLSAFSYFWKPKTYVWQTEHPSLQKSEAALASTAGSGLSLESILSGMALKSALDKVQVGTSASKEAGKRTLDRLKERYQVFRGIAGDRQAARRIDYR